MFHRQSEPFSASEVINHLTPEMTLAHADSIRQTIVNRKDASDEVLMTTTAIHSIVMPNDDLHIASRLTINHSVPTLTTSREQAMVVNVKATWLDASIKAASVGDDANVFGQSGMLVVDESIKQLSIPLQNAATVSPDVLAYFGASLVPITNMITRFNTSEYPLYFVSYQFMPDYIEKYVMQANKGGGVFVEKHDFPHVFVPMSPDCRGGLILGREIAPQQFQFSAFSIPFGFAMHIESNVIHGDSFFVGEYAITLTEKSKASTVLLRQADESLLPIEQVSISSDAANLHLFSLFNHASVTVNHCEASISNRLI